MTGPGLPPGERARLRRRRSLAGRRTVADRTDGGGAEAIEVRPTIALLKAHDYARWKPLRERGEAAGSVGPYSVGDLESHGFEVRYSDAMFERPWTHPIVERGLRRLARRRPELSGMGNALANRRLITHADITLGIFENEGSFAAFARGRRLGALAPRRMALMVCWMAEWAQRADRRTLACYRRVLDGADLIIFFSKNQAEVFEGALGVDRARLLAVSFGIDSQFFAHVPAREDGYVLAVGTDGTRDHELLVEAVEDSGIPTRIYAPALAVANLPANVTWIKEAISHVAYRQALAGARLVVVPTVAPKFPSGQTVVLEAMASSRPVITTASDAMRDYVEDGVTGVLVPRADADALRRAIERLLQDDALCASLATNALAAVERTFNQATMWASIAPRLHDLLGDGVA
jgi:glycosyltransferase involved in cell wall biosynthesis